MVKTCKDRCPVQRGLNLASDIVTIRPSMESTPPTPVLTRGHGATIPLAFALCVLLLVGCARHGASDDKQVRLAAETQRGRYLVQFTAVRLKDQSPLTTATIPVGVGQRVTVKRTTPKPTEITPEFTAFTAALDPTAKAGVLQLVTKVAIREAAHNKKGKLKFSQRNQGALLPIRPGESQVASESGDPVQITVRLERP